MQVAFVTGANSGLGRAIAESLAADHGYHVIIGSRNPDEGSSVAASLQQRGLPASSVAIDLTSDASIHAAVKSISEAHGGKLDVLVNNAGILLELSGTDLSTRTIRSQNLETNAIGPAVLTEACLPLLLRAATAPRVVFVSSSNGSIGRSLDRSWAWYGVEMPAYKASKAALNMLGVRYVTKLEGRGGMVNMVCPGFTRTKMVGLNPEGKEPEVAARKVVEMATLKEGVPTGTFVDADGVLPW